MLKYKAYWLTAVIIVFFATVLYWMLGNARFYPLIKVHLPDQGTLVFFDVPWRDLERCQNVQKVMIGGVEAHCPQCKIEMSCPTALEPRYLSALLGQATDVYVVQSGSLRIAMELPVGQKETCEAMAAQITRENKQDAHCVAAASR